MYDTLEQVARERAWARELGIVLDTDPGQTTGGGNLNQIPDAMQAPANSGANA